MITYRELSLIGSKSDFDAFRANIKHFASRDWHCVENDRMFRDYILFDYTGVEVESAEVSIYYGADTWRQGYISVANIVPLKKAQLTIDEYNAVLVRFFEDVVKPYCERHERLRVSGPTTDIFDPLDYVSEKALKKLQLFCNTANKSTGSSHPMDEERWYDFVCQTVDDGRLIDYDTLRKFLMDEDYWGSKKDSFKGSMGSFAWDEEHAVELASEYEQYTRLLEYYKRTREQ